MSLRPDPVTDCTPDVTVVVVTYNSARYLPALLTSLPAALDGIPDHAVIVVDNASHDDTLAAVRPPVRTLVLGTNRGYAAAVNAGFAHCPPRRAGLVLNPDVRLDPDALRRLLAALADPDVGIAVPRLLAPNGTTAPSLRRDPAPSRAWAAAIVGGTRAGRIGRLGEVITDPRSYEWAHDVDWASGAAMLISRACLDAVGPWDESLFLYAEETDFALRARDAGFRLQYVPDAHVTHIGGDSHVDPELWSLLVLNRARVMARRSGPVRSASFRAALLVNEAVRAVGGSATHRSAFARLLTVRRRDLLDPDLDSRRIVAR